MSSSAATNASDELPRYAPQAHPSAHPEPTERELIEANLASTITSDELPQYSPPLATPSAGRELTEHEFVELHSSGRPKEWTTLKLLSKAPSRRFPIFIGGKNITGKLEVDIPQLQRIREINIYVMGKIIVNVPEGANYCYTFLDFAVFLWSSKSLSLLPRQGRHTIPISFKLPKDVALMANKSPRVYDLPATYMEQKSLTSLEYYLKVTFRRGTFQSDSEISTVFVYVPPIQPDPPSLLRCFAYRENSRPPGPEADPEGWKTSRNFTVRGKVFGVRSVEAHCALSLATPLCYTRGTTIPCSLTIRCQDSQALDILSSPKAPAIHLERSVKFTFDSVVPDALHGRVRRLATAVWRPSSEGNVCNETMRCLGGEIHLPKDLAPSSCIVHFAIMYSVVVQPFEAVGFLTETSKTLLEEPVTIGTVFATAPSSTPILA